MADTFRTGAHGARQQDAERDSGLNAVYCFYLPPMAVTSDEQYNAIMDLSDLVAGNPSDYESAYGGLIRLYEQFPDQVLRPAIAPVLGKTASQFLFESGEDMLLMSYDYPYDMRTNGPDFANPSLRVIAPSHTNIFCPLQQAGGARSGRKIQFLWNDAQDGFVSFGVPDAGLVSLGVEESPAFYADKKAEMQAQAASPETRPVNFIPFTGKARLAL